MSNISKWNTPSLSSILTTELNSLTNGSMTAASSAITSSVDLYCDIEVNLAALSPTTGGYVAIYILVSVDASNYPAQSDADLRLTATQLLATMPVGTTSSTAQRVVARNVLLPPGNFKIKLDNQTGVNLAASGSTVKFNIYDINLNG